jgi:hypothetical protein
LARQKWKVSKVNPMLLRRFETFQSVRRSVDSGLSVRLVSTSWKQRM